jgi:competence protein ComEC
MATVVLSAIPFQKKGNSLNSLGLAGLCWLIISPGSIVTPGYQLSFAATAGIIALCPVITNLLKQNRDNAFTNLILQPVIVSIAVSISAFAATVPVMAYFFGNLTFFSLFANLFAVGLMSVSMNFMFAGILLQVIIPPASPILMRTAELILGIILQISDISAYALWSKLQFSLKAMPEVIVFYVAALLLIAGVNHKKIKTLLKWLVPAFLLLVACSLLIKDMTNHTQIVFFSTKKGTCAGITFPDGKRWIAGEPVEDSRTHTYRDAIEPWLRCGYSRNINAIIFPSANQNIVHNLAAILSDNHVNMIIGNDYRNDTAAREDFNSFLSKHRVPLTEMAPNTAFIPCKECTVSCVFMSSQPNLKNQAIKISVPNATILICREPCRSFSRYIVFNGETVVAENKQIYSDDVRNKGAVILDISPKKITLRKKL